jgi:membrane protein implicated in regulation of membrane protease activity
MINKELMGQIKWLVVALLISLVLVTVLEGTVLQSRLPKYNAKYVLRIKFVLEILIFFVFSAFVVFGIKGFFEMYSQNSKYHLYLRDIVSICYCHFMLSNNVSKVTYFSFH